MSNKDPNDPFAAFESDRTVIKPGAGRGPRPPGAPQQPGAPAGPAGGGAAAAMPVGKEAPLSIDALMTANLNPLVAAAAPLLSAAPRIRSMVQHPNPAGLKDALADGIRKFEAQARAEGLPNEQVVAGRYILCTLLDESAASTPWGGSGVWANQSLLVQFHNETWGGEKVFQLMSKLAENVAANRSLLELLYVVLSFGFEGRYRVVNDGKAQLDSVRVRLSQLLKQQRGNAGDKALSLRWEGVPARVSRLGSGIPMWVVMSMAALLLLAVYVVLRFSINGSSDAVFAGLRGLDAKAAPVLAPPPPPVPQPPRLANLLKPDIDAGLVSVRDLPDRSTVIIRGDGFFEAGSAQVSDKVRPLIARIEAALKSVPGTVLITGHTDNVPIRSLRYPSNWHLSQDRANAVKNVLVTSMKPERVRAEGRADAEPIGDNGTAAGRSQNRRVEITLFVAQGGAS
ncbi:MAG: DotU family type VI secretion system protein [Piscinibacter sp.]|nr:DotU family type VI secretion system protein [Piscinibacter sp.]